MSLFTLNVAPSGSFVPDTGVTPIVRIPDVPICNPGVFENKRGSYEKINDQARIDKWLSASTGEKKWEFTAPHITAYAETAVRLAAEVSVRGSTCRLAPLRGAARPCMLVEVMSKGVVQFEFFDFRQGASGLRDNEIIDDLVRILGRTNPGQEVFRLQVVDTAIGGYGINKLAALLRSIQQKYSAFRRQSWHLDIHLLHPTNGREDIERIKSVLGQRAATFEISLSLYPVPELIAEDYDEATGFEIVRDGMRFFAKPSICPGRYLLGEGNHRWLIESEDLSRTFDEFFSDAVSEVLLTDPARKLVGVVWPEYQTKA